MRRIQILSASPAIVIDAEPLGVDPGESPVSVEGFELVPAWQTRPARGKRRALAALPALAGAAAVALSASGGHGKTPMRSGEVRLMAPARPALVVQASSALGTDGAAARR
jgi:hypothetical protein